MSAYSPDIETLIQGEFKSALAAAIWDWPIRWPNEAWPAGVQTETTTGNLPVDADGNAIPCVQAEINYDPKALTCPGLDGNRLSMQWGICKVYLLVPRYWGSDDLNRKLGDLRRAFKQQTPQADPTQWQRLSTEELSVDSNGAAVEDGTRFVRTVSIKFWFTYRS
jgi:hypothetical protein